MKLQAAGRLPQTVSAAIYCRLSRDDETGNESVSIANQKAMLTRHVEQEGWNLVGIYADDGFSGTNFDRPDFIRMLNDIESGYINLVITKDLSRLGRDYLKTGYYTEIYFPQNKVRYIALNDGFDSAKVENDIAPFRNVLNEMYAKDQSRKMKSAWKTLILGGAVLGRYAPFGYKWSDTDKHRIVIDEETAPIMRRIFELAKQGYGAQAIRTLLYQEKVLTPSAWQHKRNPKLFARLFENCREDRYYDWDVSCIKQMLHNVTYIGHTLHYLCGKISYKDKRRMKNPKEKHVIIENTHEPLIDPETFELVQKRIQSRKRNQAEDNNHYFAGLVECADCGWKLTVRWITKQKYDYHHRALTCSRYRVKSKTHCSPHYISYDNLSKAVLEDIRKCAKAALKDEDRVLYLLTAAGNERDDAVQAAMKGELSKAQDRLADLDKLIAHLYEEHTLGSLQKRSYTQLTEKYQTEQAKLLERIEEMEKSLAERKQATVNAEKWLDLIKKYADIHELSAPLLNELIEKIVVHEREKSTYGYTQKIEIHYRLVGPIDLLF